jgi:hypothetical protein
LEETVGELVEARAALKAQQAMVWWLERTVTEGMKKRGATVVKTEDGEATLTAPVSYDYGKLAALKEITAPDDLVGYTPERAIMRREPERWNMTVAKTLAKLSRQHRAIIDDAKVEGTPQVKFTQKKGAR